MSTTTISPDAGVRTGRRGFTSNAQTGGYAPERSLAQRMSALDHANEIRIGNAQLRREIRALSKPDAYRRVADLLECPEGYVESMPIGRLLNSIERVGARKVDRILMVACVRSSDRRVGALTDRQRSILAVVLRDAA